MVGRHDISRRELGLSVETRPALGKKDAAYNGCGTASHFSFLLFFYNFFCIFLFIFVFIAWLPDQAVVKIVILGFD